MLTPKLLKLCSQASLAAATTMAIAFASTSATKVSALTLPASSLEPIPASLFGMHVTYPYKTAFDQTTIKYWRLWDTLSQDGSLVFWPHLERAKGQWDFKNLDAYVNTAQSKGIEIIYTIGLTPKWAAIRPTETGSYGDSSSPSEPKNIEDWRSYIRTVATRYKGKIRYYELWNEPNLKSYYSGSIDQMVVLAREAYKILKEVDPQIQVITPSVIAGNYGWLTKGGASWLDEYFSKGGAAYADIVGVHFYQEVHNAPPENIVPQIQAIQATMAKYGLQNKPLWNTETGYGDKQQNVFFTDADSMAFVARAYLVNWAAGVKRFYWYAWDNRFVVTILMVQEDNKTLTAAGKAYLEVGKWLTGATIKSSNSDTNKTWTCQFSRNGSNFWIVWNTDGETTMKVPSEWGVRQVKDLYGNQTALPASADLKIGKLPVLLTR